MDMDKYTRSQLEQVMVIAEKKIEEIANYKADHHRDLPQAVAVGLSNEIASLQGTILHIVNKLEALHARCIFCKERQPVEVSTITFICKTCDDKVFGRSGQ